MNVENSEESKERANRIIGITFAVFILIGIIMSICYELDLIPKGTEEKRSYIKEVKNLFHSDNTGFSDADIERANDYFQDGKNSFDEGNFDVAIWNFDNALILNPEFAEAYNSRGFAYLHLNELDSAMKDFNKAIALNPEFFEAYARRGIVYAVREKYDSALINYNKALELNPEYSQAYASKAVLYAAKGEFDKAFRNCDKALELDSKNYRVYLHKATFYEDLGKDEEAVKWYREFIEVAQGFDRRAVPYAEQKIEELEEKINSSSSE